MNVDWGEPSERQSKFLESDADECFYGGAAGGGKTWAILVLSCIRRIKYENSNGIIFRRSLPELERGDGIISRARAMLNGIAEWSERKHWFKFPNGSVQEFGYGETDGDMYKYQGGEWQDEVFDEVTHFSQFQIDFLRSRLRTTDGNCKPILRMASNPGNVGHGWVKSQFIDPTGDPTGQTGGKWDIEIEGWGSMSREFIPARLSDNVHLDRMYERQLLSLPDKMKDRLLYGRWDIFEGRYFTEFDEEIHVGEVEGSDYGVILGYDFGYSAPYCCLFGRTYENGRLYITDELYETNRIDSEQALDICEMGGKGHVCYADPSIFSMDGRSSRSTADIMLETGVNVVRADNSRVQGWARVRRMLNEKLEDGRPALIINPRCKNLRRTITILVHSEKNPEDLNTHQEDHPADALRYMTSHFVGHSPVVRRAVDMNKVVSYLNGEKQTEISIVDRIRRTLVHR